MKFSLPSTLSVDEVRELKRACVLGGPDGMPTLTRTTLQPNELTLYRDVDESGCLSVPWQAGGVGQLMLTSATLRERSDLYRLPHELARGKLNHLRNQTCDWTMGGLVVPPALSQRIKDATLAFSRALSRSSADESLQYANRALTASCEAADQLIHAYTTQVFHFRQQHKPKLDSQLGCQIGLAPPAAELQEILAGAFNGISIPFLLSDICPSEGDYEWAAHDALVQWATSQPFAVTGGPLIDFSPARLPSWIWLYAGDRNRLAQQLREFTIEVVDRYQDSISAWKLTTASNLPGTFSLHDDELLWLTIQVGEVAQRIAPEIDIIIGVSQPWGEYLTTEDRLYSPFLFVDTLLRSGLPVAAIDLEIVMGVTPRGTYCRDLLDLSRLLDLYALLGVPLHVTLGYPASTEPDSIADSELAIDAGFWRDGIDPQTQADWAAEFAALALCKPFVRTVRWTHFADAEPHQFPSCGLVDAENKPRPALESLRKLRERYLK